MNRLGLLFHIFSLFIFSLALGISNYTYAASTATETKYPEWIQEFVPYVKTLSRNVAIYHWQGVDNIIDHGIDNYIYYSTERFFTEIDIGGSAGTGLYFAIDPVVTFECCGNPPALIKSEFKKGVRFINIDDSKLDSQPLSDLAKEQIKALGCDNPSTLHNLVQPQNSSTCVEAKRILLDTLSVHVLVYSYTSRTIDICKSTSLAFIVNSPTVFDRSKTLVYTKTTPKTSDTQEERGFLEEYFRRINDPLRHFYFNDTPMASDKFDAWAKEHIFGCGNYPEDQ